MRLKIVGGCDTVIAWNFKMGLRPLKQFNSIIIVYGLESPWGGNLREPRAAQNAMSIYEGPSGF
jgi:hypothetical protein